MSTSLFEFAPKTLSTTDWRKRPSQRPIVRAVALSLAALTLVLIFVSEVDAQSTLGVSTRRDGAAIRQDIFRSLRQARRCLTEGDQRCAQAGVNAVLLRDDLNSYEKAQAWNTSGAVHAEAGDTPAAGPPQPLFRINPEPWSLRFGSVYSPMPDGERFIVSEMVGENSVQLLAVLNWEFEP